MCIILVRLEYVHNIGKIEIQMYRGFHILYGIKVVTMENIIPWDYFSLKCL